MQYHCRASRIHQHRSRDRVPCLCAVSSREMHGVYMSQTKVTLIGEEHELVGSCKFVAHTKIECMRVLITSPTRINGNCKARCAPQAASFHVHHQSSKVTRMQRSISTRVVGEPDVFNDTLCNPQR
eukprot:m.1190049 g.1190049  ORF g.1190049 m.1190049 type:complete len:126 (-) comp24554_c3_seq65:3809-4186(-)